MILFHYQYDIIPWPPWYYSTPNVILFTLCSDQNQAYPWYKVWSNSMSYMIAFTGYCDLFHPRCSCTIWYYSTSSIILFNIEYDIVLAALWYFSNVMICDINSWNYDINLPDIILYHGPFSRGSFIFLCDIGNLLNLLCYSIVICVKCVKIYPEFPYASKPLILFAKINYPPTFPTAYPTKKLIDIVFLIQGV